MNNKLRAAALVTIAAALTACGTNTTRQNVYSTGNTMQPMAIQMATVVETREVEIEAPQTGSGAAAGTAIGGTAAYSSGQGGIVGTIAGAVVGGVVGHLAEGALNKKQGVEITYKLDDTNKIEALVQEKDEVNFMPGDRIKILRGTFRARAVKVGAP